MNAEHGDSSLRRAPLIQSFVPTRYEFLDNRMLDGAPMDTADLDDPYHIVVEWRGGATWAVKRLSRVWCEEDGEWEYEPSPSNRTNAFLARTRYPKDEALAIGFRLATSNGSTSDPGLGS